MFFLNCETFYLIVFWNITLYRKYKTQQHFKDNFHRYRTSGIERHNANGSSWCLNIWQLWNFNWERLSNWTCIQRELLDKYLSGTSKPCNTLQKVYVVQQKAAKRIFPSLVVIGCNASLTHTSCKSLWAWRAPFLSPNVQ